MKNSHPLPDAALKGHIAVVGMTGGGKTFTTKGIVEHILAKDPAARVCVLDPIKSDWWGITSSASGKRPGLPFHILGGPRGHVPLHETTGKAIGELVGSGALPLSIIDMADFGPGGLQTFFNDFAPALLRKMRGVVHLVLEEAHEFAPKERAGFGGETMTVHFAKKLATAGRSKGVRIIAATQRTQQLHNSVLGSCQTVIAHQLTYPADIEPVSKWFKGHVDKEVFGRFMETLTSLPTGTGWLCSGQAKVAEMVQFPPIWTFDNSATPDSSTSDLDVATAPVDRDKLVAIMGDAVKEAEANDPASLKKRIKELETELAKRPAAETIVDTAAIEKARSEGLAQGRYGAFHAARGDLEGLSRRLGEVILELRTKWTGEADTPNPTPGIVHRPAPFVPQPPTRIAVPSTPAAKASTVVADGLSRPQQRILDALAWLEWVGSHDVDKVRVAMLADQSPKSSGFRANLSTLSGLELLTHGGDKVSLTEDGRAAANKPAGNPTNAELHAAIRAKVSGPQWLMLQALINVYPGAMPRDGLAEASNQSPTSSGFRANLSTLSGLGFVKYVPNAMVRATDTLFVER